MLGVCHPWSIPLVYLVPWSAMHVVYIKEIAHEPPSVAENLGEFLHRVHLHLHAGNIQGAVSDRLLSGSCVYNSPGATCPVKQILPVVRNYSFTHPGHKQTAFLCLQVIFMKPGSLIWYRLSKKYASSRAGQQACVVSFRHVNCECALGNSISVYYNVYLIVRFGLIAFRFLVCRGGLFIITYR